ncbi:RagB/SusD family nutrient uptake outer membrane protein [Pedobacter sp. MR2016-19]|uniref:RagB/SusD family nutrient uptake outer membrane protein n=1 Tax=Pedobacter sp. MR2016-19 TaxID=2780089 RepID=UPI001874EBE2|nr:RagB/SusD family nutrient uptake outer membrane protein [Pedobacter sp. MR2016-19]MBE5318021.1 RagB/SusD family nutrient uptake outer membrane protein [Pedobacter sp. MR2016-19]
MKKLIIYTCCALSVFAAASCKKFLDLKPVSVSTDQTFWKNEADADKGIASGYALLRKTLNKASGLAFYAYGDLPTDEFSAANFYRFDNINRIEWAISVPSSNTDDNMMQMRRYDTFYSAIDQANRCLSFIPTIPDDKFSSSTTKNSLIGEAYFLRAFNYFYMTRIWGDVPLVTKSMAIADAVDIPRTKAADVISQCISDVNMAISILSWNYTNPANKAVRANKGAAYALLAHIYAWQGDYRNCNDTIDKLIGQNFYQYVNRDNYLTIFKGRSTEGIFEIAQSDENEGSTGGIANFTLKAPYLTTRTDNALFTLNKTTLTALFSDQSDKRFQNAFALTSSTDPICIKYSNITYANGQNVVIPIAHNNIIIFRLADIKLLKAEALAALGENVSSRTVLNEVRSQAGLSAWSGNDADLFAEVIAERGRELFLEGHRFYDLVRLGRQTGIMNFGDNKMNKSDFDAGKYYWPLDPALMVINKKLTQTPFWSSKL